jgi:hypothetical protein
MEPAEFAVWTILAVFTIFFLFNWVLRKRKYRRAILLEKNERIALQAAPRITMGWAAVLLLFLFIDFSKFYLLVIFPLIYLFASYQIANHITKED